MDDKSRNLRTRQARARDDAQSLQEQIDRMERTCQHCWSAPEYKPVRHDAYTIPADKGGGVDRRPECHVPARTDERWIRICSKCGKKEETDKQKTARVVKEPDFGS
jgi:hypothetical protein